MDASLAVELAWNRTPGGEGCIDQQELAGKVESTLGHGVFAAAGTPRLPAVTVQGRVGPAEAGRGWVAVVEVRREGTSPLRRELMVDAAECRQLDEAIVLVVALLVEAALPSAPALVLPSRQWTAAVSIGPDVALAYGMLPGLAVGVGLSSEARIGRFWPVSLWGHAWPVSEALQQGSGGRLGAWTFGVGICPTLPQGAIDLFACAGASGGAVYSNGVGLSVANSDIVRPYLQAELRAGLRVRVVGPLFARGEVGGGIPFAHDTYTYTQADGTVQSVFQTAPVFPLGRLGIEVRAP